MSVEDIARRIDALADTVDRLKAQQTDIQRGALDLDRELRQLPPPRERVDWGLFFLGVVVGLGATAVLIVASAACKCPPTWVP